MLIWQVLDDLLLLMMSLDCPLAIRHKNGEYTLCMEIGGVFCFVLFWGTKIVFRSFFDVFLFIWLKMYLFLKFYMLGGDTMFYVSFIVSCFTCDTLVIDLYYDVIHGICLLFSVL